MLVLACVAAPCFFFSSRRRHTRCSRDWSSDVCSSDLGWPEKAQENAMKSRNFRASSFRFRFPSMAATPRSFLALILACSCLPLGVDFPAVAATPPAAKDKKQKPDPALKGLPITELSPDEAILHALNRLAYGPRPGDVERVRQMGLAKWIERQLNPNSIDDKGVEARLEDYPTLRMSTAKLIVEYPQPKPAVRQAERQARERAQDEQRRADAAPASEQQTQARETQDAQSSSPSGEARTPTP